MCEQSQWRHSETVREIDPGFEPNASSKLKLLLETKHIYQNVVIDGKRLVDEWTEKVRSMGATVKDGEYRFETAAFVWGDEELHVLGRSGEPEPVVTLSIRNPKLFRSTCGTSEVFKPLWSRDLASELNRPVPSYAVGSRAEFPGFQLLFIGLQCLRCSGRPEGFMVRRDRWRLILEGRSPMEHLEVPKFVPKPERNLFRDALIAAHGGKILAALFYLQVFIEQFARRVLNETGRRYGA
jgi:hypothetical protein